MWVREQVRIAEDSVPFFRTAAGREEKRWKCPSGPRKVGDRAKVNPGDQIRVTAVADDGQLINWWPCTAAGRTSHR